MTHENVKTIADLVNVAGKEHGERVFLRYEDNDVVKDVTYASFVDTCKSVAMWAEEKNNIIGHKARVGVFGGSSHEYISILFGIMANGNVVVPLDTQLNVSGLAEAINNADLDYVFYDWDNYELVEGAKNLCAELNNESSLELGSSTDSIKNSIEAICLQKRKHVECIQNIWKNYPASEYEFKTDLDVNECAMVLFTSGTTGKGKGVMLSQGNLIDNVFCTEDDGHPENEIYMNVLPVHHIFCLNGDFMIALRYGNVLCLNQNMAKLAAHIQLFQPTVVRMVPMMAKTLYNRIAVLREQYKDKSIDEIKALVLGKGLHKIVSGGGYLAPDLAKCYNDIGIKIAQGYGMSECSPKISAPDWSRLDKVASVGKIVKGCELRIVDGEIQVKSPSVMMGYYKDPEETAKTIVDGGWLRTGDLGYIDEEGFLFFTGRCKNLIILSNGENVAPEQLENLFVDETLIEDILVYGENDMICAEVYPNLQLAETLGIDDLETAISEIIKKHNQDLPSYKRILQSSVRYIPFEKTSSRKIIRGKYFEQKAKQQEEMANIKLPENDFQQEIFNSVAECLGHNKFGIDTDFYSIGLDSLGSVLLLSSLYEKLQISITLQELSENATVEKLEAFAAAKKDNNVDYTVREVYPLTGLQTYFAYILRGHSTSNLPFLFKLDNSVDLEKFRESVIKVFDIHPELKDIIELRDGAFVNVRNDAREIDIPIIRLNDKDWEQEKAQIIKPFMYTEGEELFHSAIYVTDSARYFFFDLAHIIGDGMSVNIIFEDINAIYKGEKVSKQSYTMYEYILDYLEDKENGTAADTVRYFMGLTNDCKIRRSILAKKDSSNLEKGINQSIRKRFDSLSRKKVLAYCKKHGVSENVLFLTAYNYCVSVFANEDDILTTSIHSGRTDSRWNRIIGSLFTTYLYRYTRKAHETVPELLKRGSQQILKTMDCRLSTLHADEMFIQYQGDILNIDEMGGAPVQREKLSLDSLPFHLQIMSDKKGYYTLLRYWENRFDKEQLEIFLRCYEAILNAMLVESSVRRVKKYIPEVEKPKHFYIEASKINAEASKINVQAIGNNDGTNFQLIKNVDGSTKVKVYVLDDSYQKKPYGGWGDLYIMDYETEGYVDQVENPYGGGTLYQTGYVARITPDGEVEFLESAGRTVMIEGIKGRDFVDLHKVEEVLCECEGVTEARAYVYYDKDNGMHVGVDVTGDTGVTEADVENIKAYAREQLSPVWVPERIVCL